MPPPGGIRVRFRAANAHTGRGRCRAEHACPPGRPGRDDVRGRTRAPPWRHRMRSITSRPFLAGLLAATAFGAAIGLSPAEAKGGPPKTAAPGKDKTPPAITCPSGIAVDAYCSGGARVAYS